MTNPGIKHTELILPHHFEVNEDEWNTALNEISRKSVIGSLIIVGLSIVFSLLLSISLPTLVFVIVFVILFIVKRKESNELRSLAGNKYVLEEKSISILAPSVKARKIDFNELKMINKSVWGLSLDPKEKSIEAIRIPKTVAGFDAIVLYFQNLGLLRDDIVGQNL